MTATVVGEPFTHTAGFGGLMAVVAALIAAAGVAVTVVQRGRAERRDAWWARFAWVVDHSATDLGGPLTKHARSAHRHRPPTPRR